MIIKLTKVARMFEQTTQTYQTKEEGEIYINSTYISCMIRHKYPPEKHSVVSYFDQFDVEISENDYTTVYVGDNNVEHEVKENPDYILELITYKPALQKPRTRK